MSELIDVKIDGKVVSVEPGTLVIRAAEKAGVIIPRFCDHPLLKPAAACRQCLVEIAAPGRDGTVAKMPRPMPACAERVRPQMEVYTQHTSEKAKEAQFGVMEFLLINHPLDCPICDKGGECPLQNQAMTEGRTDTRFVDVKRTYPKPLKIASNVLLDRDRCVLCQRCVRFQKEIAGDPFIQLQGRGGGTPGYDIHALHGSQIGQFDASALDFCDSDGAHPHKVSNGLSDPYGQPGLAEGFSAGPVAVEEKDIEGRPFTSYFTGNIIQICPVGALTSESYRFRARPFDLMSVPGVTEHDASGSALRVDMRRGVIVRRHAGEDPEVNEEWITDKDRWAFQWQNGEDRLSSAFVKENGERVAVSLPESYSIAARKLSAVKGKGIAVLIGGRLPMEDAYAYAKFARIALNTNDIDFRTRTVSEEENAFLASTVAGSGLGVTYKDLETAGHVLTVGFEAEEECGSVFLRLRKGVFNKKTSVSVLAPYATAGTKKLSARLIPVVPSQEATALDYLREGDETFDALKNNGIILVGERLGACEGGLSAALRLAERTGARLAWIPRRAGDRGALEVGAVGHLLPGGRPVENAQARADIQAVWGVESLPTQAGKSVDGIIEAALNGSIAGLVCAGVDLSDLPSSARKALEKLECVISLEVRDTELASYADVVIPVAPPSEKGGSFVNWEGRIRPFGQALTSVTMPDRTVLHEIASRMGVNIGTAKLADCVDEIIEIGSWNGPRLAVPGLGSPMPELPQDGYAVLASWNLMLGAGCLQDFEPHLASGARAPYAILSGPTAHKFGLNTSMVEVSGPEGSVVLPYVTNSDIPDSVVWLPQNSRGCSLATLGVQAGSLVQLKAAGEVA
ncbi:MAG: NADH-quinone oxidoreductase subunit G [Actinomycetaceae bacterium]|nr:NADH-quinone oxidoreductase subunit G [Actinomycetaceae bacterium]